MATPSLNSKLETSILFYRVPNWISTQLATHLKISAMASLQPTKEYNFFSQFVYFSTSCSKRFQKCFIFVQIFVSCNNSISFEISFGISGQPGPEKFRNFVSAKIERFFAFFHQIFSTLPKIESQKLTEHRLLFILRAKN